MSLSELFQSPDFSCGLAQLTRQPAEVNNMDKFKEYHGEKWPQAFSVMTTWESLGALVFRGDFPFHLVYDLFSGLIVFHHQMTQPLILWVREQGGDTRFEWFTWIAERIEEYNVGDASPQVAHLEYKDWKPPTLKK